jgi:hypothetical protein
LPPRRETAKYIRTTGRGNVRAHIASRWSAPASCATLNRTRHEDQQANADQDDRPGF